MAGKRNQERREGEDTWDRVHITKRTASHTASREEGLTCFPRSSIKKIDLVLGHLRPDIRKNMIRHTFRRDAPVRACLRACVCICVLLIRLLALTRYIQKAFWFLFYMACTVIN